METNRTLIGLLCFIGTALAASLCLAQDDPTSAQATAGARQEPYITVFSLAHADAHAVRAAIEALDLDVRVAAANDSTLILSGSDPTVQHMLNGLLKQLDVPDGMSDELNTAFIPLDRIPGQGFIDLIHAAAPGRRTRIALDETSRLLVVHATGGELKAIRRVVDAVSKPPARLTLRFYFIRGRIGANEGKPTPLPGNLGEVDDTLWEHGLTDLSLMAPVIISVEEGRAFEQNAQLRTRDDQDAVEDLQFHVQGRARLDGDNKTVHMDVEVHVHGEFQTTALDQGRTLFEMTTTMAVRRGHYYVLAAAPASSASGSVIAVVVMAN